VDARKEDPGADTELEPGGNVKLTATLEYHKDSTRKPETPKK